MCRNSPCACRRVMKLKEAQDSYDTSNREYQKELATLQAKYLAIYREYRFPFCYMRRLSYYIGLRQWTTTSVALHRHWYEVERGSEVTRESGNPCQHMVLRPCQVWVKHRRIQAVWPGYCCCCWPGYCWFCWSDDYWTKYSDISDLHFKSRA